LFSVIPFTLFINEDDLEENWFLLAKLAKMGKLYKLLKLSKIMRMLRIIKKKNSILNFLTENIRIGIGAERLITAMIAILFFCHIMACFWYMVSDWSNSPNS